MTSTAPIILVVEDEDLIRVLVIEVLQEHGYDVRSASSAKEALGLLADHCSEFDVLLTDINLGVGENGLQLARKARDICPGIRVIYVTGGAQARSVAERVPDSRLITKPYDLEHVCNAVAEELPPRRAG